MNVGYRLVHVAMGFGFVISACSGSDTTPVGGDTAVTYLGDRDVMAGDEPTVGADDDVPQGDAVTGQADTDAHSGDNDTPQGDAVMGQADTDAHSGDDDATSDPACTSLSVLRASQYPPGETVLSAPLALCQTLVTYAGSAGFFIQDSPTGAAIEVRTQAAAPMPGTYVSLNVVRLDKASDVLAIVEHSDLVVGPTGPSPASWAQTLGDASSELLPLGSELADELVSLTGTIVWVSADMHLAQVALGTAGMTVFVQFDEASRVCTRGILTLYSGIVTYAALPARWQIRSWHATDYSTTTTACGATPRAADDPGLIVVNELLFRSPGSDVNCDGAYTSQGDEQFIELVNVSDEAVSLRGLTVWDRERNPSDAAHAPRHVFDDIVLDPGRVLVLFGGGVPGSCLLSGSGSCGPQCQPWPADVALAVADQGLGLEQDDALTLLDNRFDLDDITDGQRNSVVEDSVVFIVDYQFYDDGLADESLTSYPEMVRLRGHTVFSPAITFPQNPFVPHGQVDGAGASVTPFDASPYSPGTNAHGFPFWGSCFPQQDIASLRAHGADSYPDNGQLCAVVVTMLATEGFYVQADDPAGPGLLVQDPESKEQVQVGDIIDVVVAEVGADGQNLHVADNDYDGDSQDNDGYSAGSIVIRYLDALPLTPQSVADDLSEAQASEVVSVGPVVVGGLVGDDGVDITYRGDEQAILYLNDNSWIDTDDANNNCITFSLDRAVVEHDGTDWSLQSFASPGEDGNAVDEYPSLSGFDDSGCAPPLEPWAPLLISEVVTSPSAAEFIELYNNSDQTVFLEQYYVADFNQYWDISANFSSVSVFNSTDFCAHFPSDAVLGPHEFAVIAINPLASTTTFFDLYGGFTLSNYHALSELVPCNPGGAGDIGANASLTNAAEMVVLFAWDTLSDLVVDLDYMAWCTEDSAAPNTCTASSLTSAQLYAVDKTGSTIDGPDGDSVASAYQGDTAVTSQSFVAANNPDVGCVPSEQTVCQAIERVDLTEGTETATGGNGPAGHDETSENCAQTFAVETGTTASYVAGSPGMW